MANKSKVIAITGVTAGLGLAMTDRFHKLGHVVVGCGRNKDKISELNKSYSTKEGSLNFGAVDVTSDSAVKEWTNYVVDNFGAPSFLLNNAGIVNSSADLWNVPVQEFDRVIDINIKGAVNCIRHFVPKMIENGNGIIVNFSSGWGRSVASHVAPYCCSKWGIEGLSKALALELPSPLASVALDPGMINTGMVQSVFGSSAQNVGENPSSWAPTACSYILNITRDHNGKSLRVG